MLVEVLPQCIYLAEKSLKFTNRKYEGAKWNLAEFGSVTGAIKASNESDVD